MQAIMLLLPLIVCIIYKENFINYIAFVATSSFCIGLSFLLKIKTNSSIKIGPKDGLVIVGLCWLIICLIGALPYVISSSIPNYIDAFFETCSGYSTTGSSVVKNVEGLDHSILFYRSLTQWIGGMGVLVFMLAFDIGQNEDTSIHLLRAESTGPSVGKLSSKMKFTTRTLYYLYIGLTSLEIILLIIGKNPLFDSICISLSTTATGGFSIYNAGLANISVYSQYIISIFMLLAGINFSLYYYLFIKSIKVFFKDEELRVYLGIVLLAVIGISINIYNRCSNFEEAFRTSLFQVASIITTTGFATVDFAYWPSLSQLIIIILMFIGSCAGSTSGGVKVSRMIIINKSNFRRIDTKLNNDRIKSIQINHQSLDSDIIHETKSFFSTYILILFIFTLLISLDGTNDLITNFTASLSSISNVGPGFGNVGPCSTYVSYSYISKFFLSIEMLIGRLELYPILVLFFPRTWQRY